MNNLVKDVVIVGGGTAGWMTASYLQKALQNSVNIRVIETPKIPKIGVGEATVPNLQKAFFDYLGLKEEDWMPKCNASFKMAVKFINWKSTDKNDHFYHPFGLLPDCDQIPLSHYWLNNYLSNKTNKAFDYTCFKEPPIMDAKLSPKWLNGEKSTRYAWHFDAHLVADFLMKFSIKNKNVSRIESKVIAIEKDNKGFIRALTLEDGRKILGDLFIDCSGFEGLLINKALEEPFIDMSDQLLCNSAVATSITHDDEKYGIEPYTSAIAMNSGWTWKIPMLGRFGTGYVYSDSFSTDDQAVKDLCKLWNINENKTTLNKIKFRVGRNRHSWVKNCISIGLSSCFLEPLESTGIYFIYAAIYHLVKYFPDLNFNPILIDKFNNDIAEMFDDTRDFIQSHFYFSPRMDTEFWKANKSLKLTDSILNKVERYKAGLPINQPTTDESNYYGSFEAEFKNFWTNGSYYCIFSGLGFIPDNSLPLIKYKQKSINQANEIINQVKNKQDQLLLTLPSNYDYLCQLHMGKTTILS
ncbi:tryptophan 7-halogenase [Thiotrichales bacterium 19X7-9]|nr:tryptophan 7-halogenase [Thiotrichales bacterium 19X7-9]TNF69726.1 MAG: tryptophan 7-halogenase [Gammaproteobacteria bacterium]UTW42447.1 tryptophan 7-halogenase [bacterium SCSIO 12844]